MNSTKGSYFFFFLLSDSTSDLFGRNFRQVDGIRRYAAYTSEISMLIFPLHNFFLLIKYSNYELRASEGDQSLWDGLLMLRINEEDTRRGFR